MILDPAVDAGSAMTIPEAEHAIRVRLFVASPSDCERERSVIRSLVDELNRAFCCFFGVVLDLVDWKDVVPSLGSPQTVVD